MIKIETVLPYIGGMESCIGGRNDNQDSCGYAETIHGLLVVVCDGMGGGPSGKLASSIAVNEIIQYFKSQQIDTVNDVKVDEILISAIKSANSAIFKSGEIYPENRGMGTTVVAMVINKDCAVIAHVGDSRCYQMRNGNIIFKTHDHSVVAELVRSGNLTEEQARLSPNSNIITRSLGTKENVEIEVDIQPYEKKDRFYLCTDGVWGSMPQKQLAKQFYRYPQLSNILESTAIIVDEIGVNNGGHHDNHTLLILETKIKSKLIVKMSSKVKRIMQILLVLLFISLIVNIIAISNRENRVMDGSVIAAKDSMIMELENKNERVKESANIERNNLVDSIITLKNEINLLKKSRDSLLIKSKEIQKKEVNKALEKKVLCDKMKELFFGDKSLLADWNFIVKKEGAELRKCKINVRKRIIARKPHFEELNEMSKYKKLLELFDNPLNSKKVELEKLIDYFKESYK